MRNYLNISAFLLYTGAQVSHMNAQLPTEGLIHEMLVN